MAATRSSAAPFPKSARNGASSLLKMLAPLLEGNGDSGGFPGSKEESMGNGEMWG
jgi:hypothetical protein